MPFIDQTDRRSVMQNAVPATNEKAPDFGETFAASLGNTIDENLSISGTLNREGWENRQRLIKEKIDTDQLDRSKYLDARGRFDYNRASMDLNDPSIKTDEQLTIERNEMLANRRAYSEDVLARGNGIAQFLGMANAYMLDPISIATMPIALPGNAAKSLSIAGRALLTARNVAGIEAATELAIQPLVYTHKQDIESPYTGRDAIESIGMAALGGAALGGVVGGVSGYLKRVIGEVEAKGVIDSDGEYALESIARMTDSIEYGRAQRQTYDVSMVDYDKVLKGEYDSFLAASKNTVRELEREITEVSKDAETVNDLIKAAGGFDRARLELEGIDPASFKWQGSNPLFRKTGGKLPDEVAEMLNEANFRGGNWDENSVIDLADSLARGDRILTNPEVDAHIQFNQKQIDDLSLRPDEDYLESIYKGAREADVQDDLDYLSALEQKYDEFNKPSITPEKFARPDIPKASNQVQISRQDFILDEMGIKDDYNRAIQDFNEIDKPKILIDDSLQDAAPFMKSIDDELEGIESVLSCAHG